MQLEKTKKHITCKTVDHALLLSYNLMLQPEISLQQIKINGEKKTPENQTKIFTET